MSGFYTHKFATRDHNNNNNRGQSQGLEEDNGAKKENLEEPRHHQEAPRHSEQHSLG